MGPGVLCAAVWLLCNPVVFHTWDGGQTPTGRQHTSSRANPVVGAVAAAASFPSSALASRYAWSAGLGVITLLADGECRPSLHDSRRAHTLWPVSLETSYSTRFDAGDNQTPRLVVSPHNSSHPPQLQKAPVPVNTARFFHSPNPGMVREWMRRCKACRECMWHYLTCLHQCVPTPLRAHLSTAGKTMHQAKRRRLLGQNPE